MSEERDRRIQVLLERGVPKIRIAEELGITRETVSRVAARLGYPSRKRSGDTRDWAKIRSFYEAGNSAAETMRHFGFKQSTWTAAIARGVIAPRPRDYPEKPAGETRVAVERLFNEGFGVAEIAGRLGVSKPTVCYHLRKLGVPAEQKFARRHDWEAIAAAYEDGMPMVVGRRTGRGHLKARLIEAGLKENRCEVCGITHWMGKPVNMQLHHKNGDGSDNRLENLQLLCGTCHSQTDTYGGRNGHRRSKRHLRLVEPPDDDQEDVA